MNNLKQSEKTLKAFANKKRLEILQYLKKRKEASVSSIANDIKLSIRSTSRHLAVLRLAEVVEREQRGPEMYYRIDKDLGQISQSLVNLIG